MNLCYICPGADICLYANKYIFHLLFVFVFLDLKLGYFPTGADKLQICVLELPQCNNSCARLHRCKRPQPCKQHKRTHTYAHNNNTYAHAVTPSYSYWLMPQLPWRTYELIMVFINIVQRSLSLRRSQSINVESGKCL